MQRFLWYSTLPAIVLFIILPDPDSTQGHKSSATCLTPFHVTMTSSWLDLSVISSTIIHHMHGQEGNPFLFCSPQKLAVGVHFCQGNHFPLTFPQKLTLKCACSEKVKMVGNFDWLSVGLPKSQWPKKKQQLVSIVCEPLLWPEICKCLNCLMKMIFGPCWRQEDCLWSALFMHLTFVGPMHQSPSAFAKSWHCMPGTSAKLWKSHQHLTPNCFTWKAWSPMVSHSVCAQMKPNLLKPWVQQFEATFWATHCANCKALTNKFAKCDNVWQKIKILMLWLFSQKQKVNWWFTLFVVCAVIVHKSRCKIKISGEISDAVIFVSVILTCQKRDFCMGPTWCHIQRTNGNAFQHQPECLNKHWLVPPSRSGRVPCSWRLRNDNCHHPWWWGWDW